jgi:hypothetical protein
MPLLIKRDATGNICSPPQCCSELGSFIPGHVHIALQKVLREEILRGASIIELSDHLWEISLGDGKPYFYSIEAQLPEDAQASGGVMKDDAQRETLSVM